MGTTWLAAVLLLLLLLLVSGCSSMRLGYNNASQLTWWWLDDHVDFSREQAPPVRQAIDRFYDWHRATQLPVYATLLDELQPLVQAPATPADICRLQDRFGPLLKPSLDRALRLFAERLPPLSDAQLIHLRERYDRGNADAQDEHLQPDPKRRLEGSIKRTVERAEKLYGPLEAAQLAVIRDGVARSPFDAERWMQDRKRRQARLLATLRRLQSERADVDQRLVVLQTLTDDYAVSPVSAEGSYPSRLREYNCAFVARLHNSTTASQRERARTTLQGWQNDLQALAGPA